MDERRLDRRGTPRGLRLARDRYLDLDGSLDLARDVATGGFVLEDGVMRTTNAPGLGVAERTTAPRP